MSSVSIASLSVFGLRALDRETDLAFKWVKRTVYRVARLVLARGLFEHVLCQCLGQWYQHPHALTSGFGMNTIGLVRRVFGLEIIRRCAKSTT